MKTETIDTLQPPPPLRKKNLRLSQHGSFHPGLQPVQQRPFEG